MKVWSFQVESEPDIADSVYGYLSMVRTLAALVTAMHNISPSTGTSALAYAGIRVLKEVVNVMTPEEITEWGRLSHLSSREIKGAWKVHPVDIPDDEVPF